jgi:hypothetical protein
MLSSILKLLQVNNGKKRVEPLRGAATVILGDGSGSLRL